MVPRGAQGFQLVPDLAPTEDEFVFDKLGMSAFEGTPLQFALRESRHHNPCDLRYRIGDRQGMGPGR
jgi:nicotinamidase-related amidase